MTQDKQELIAEMDKRITMSKAMNAINDVKFWQDMKAKIEEYGKQQYEKGKIDQERQRLGEWATKYEQKGRQDERERIKKAVEKYHSCYEGDTLILCTVAEFDKILEGKEE